MRRKAELRCCLGCGRDTYGLYCHRCIDHDTNKPSGSVPEDRLPLEDDYSEESNANSVCQDDSVARV